MSAPYTRHLNLSVPTKFRIVSLIQDCADRLGWHALVIHTCVYQYALLLFMSARISELCMCSSKLWFWLASILDKFSTDLIVAVRPEFTGTIAIKSGLHPILETLSPAGTLVPNDVYCDDSSCFQVIRGPKWVVYFNGMKLLNSSV